MTQKEHNKSSAPSIPCAAPAAPAGALDLDDFDVDDGLCEGEIDLEEWDDMFQCDGPYTLRFDVDTDQLLEAFTPLQKSGYRYLLENAGDMIAPVLNELLKQWPEIQDTYSYPGQPPEERQREIPDVSTAEDFFSLLFPTGATIYDLDLDGQPYIGLSFSCSWDREHGFGAMMCGCRVVEIGGEDTALLSWCANRDRKAALKSVETR